MRLLIIGAGGFLGAHIRRRAPGGLDLVTAGRPARRRWWDRRTPSPTSRIRRFTVGGPAAEAVAGRPPAAVTPAAAGAAARQAPSPAGTHAAIRSQNPRPSEKVNSRPRRTAARAGGRTMCKRGHKSVRAQGQLQELQAQDAS
jgi:hypothetical protein